LSDIEHLTQIEKLLLMAAAVHGLRPGIELKYANTARVVLKALEWAGLDSKEVLDAWNTDDWHPSLQAVYGPLVHMTQMELLTGGFRPAERPGPALFEGGGNWGVPGDPKHPPACPQFNSCRLTATGDRLALELLADHPEYGPPGEPHVSLNYLNWGQCVATNMVLDAGHVGCMYRVEPVCESDSGWRFTAGRESEDYLADVANKSWQQVFIIADIDKNIIPLLKAPIGSEFQRQDGSVWWTPILGPRG
jgi:hypothetical protein